MKEGDAWTHVLYGWLAPCSLDLIDVLIKRTDWTTNAYCSQSNFIMWLSVLGFSVIRWRRILLLIESILIFHVVSWLENLTVKSKSKLSREVKLGSTITCCKQTQMSGYHKRFGCHVLCFSCLFLHMQAKQISDFWLNVDNNVFSALFLLL